VICGMKGLERKKKNEETIPTTIIGVREKKEKRKFLRRSFSPRHGGDERERGKRKEGHVVLLAG